MGRRPSVVFGQRKLAAVSVAAAMLFTACQGNSNSPGALPDGGKSGTQAQSSSEQLIVSIYSDSGNAVTVYRYAIPSGDELGSFQLTQSGFISAIYASADDEYILSRLPGVTEVDGPSGSEHTISTSSGAAMSTDLSTFAAFSIPPDNGAQESITEYREPFTSPLFSQTFFIGTMSIGFVALNGNASQAIEVPGSFAPSGIAIQPLPSGQAEDVSFNSSELSHGDDLVDGTHSLYYALAQATPTGPINQIEVIDTATATYVGDINIPESPSGEAVNQVTGDLYIAIGASIYVYNVPESGCGVSTRVLPSPISNPQLAVDRLGNHLFVYTNQLGPSKIYDLNPTTGSIQGTYPGAASSNFEVPAVVAQ